MTNFTVGIYIFLGPNLENLEDTLQKESGAYWLLHVLDSKGLVDREILGEIYREIDQGPPPLVVSSFLGPFYSEQEVEAMLFRVCDKLNYEEAAICPVSDYNSIIEELTALDLSNPHNPNLPQIIFSKSKHLNMPESSKKKGLFGKIFY